MAFDPKEHIINLKGKDYLQVAHRLVWFRDTHPQGTILTEIITFEPVVCVKATIINGDNHVLSTGHGTAAAKPNAVWAGREIEKAETAAIGRALAAAGFGTQFSDEYDDADDNHLSDSPQNKPAQQPKPAADDPGKAPWTKTQMGTFMTHWRNQGWNDAAILKSLGVSRLSEWTQSQDAADAALVANTDDTDPLNEYFPRESENGKTA